MKKALSLLFLGTLLASCGNPSSGTKGATISGSDYDPEGGADAYANAGDQTSDMYYQHPDFYDMTSNDHLTILSQYKTFQQTTEYSCGPAAALTVLTHYGITNYTEWDLAVGMHASVDEETSGLPGTADEFGEYGTSVGKMYDFFSTLPNIQIVETSYLQTYEESQLLAEGDCAPADVGNLPGAFSWWAPYASGLDGEGNPIYVDDAKDAKFTSWVLTHLGDNQPIMVEWGDWDGHWQTIIGYDTMGTASVGDDMIIVADSYDTSDHCQDGYYFYPVERFFYMWKDRAIAPKPFQLQPYIIIDLK